MQQRWASLPKMLHITSINNPDSAVKTPRWDTVSFAHQTIFKAMTDTQRGYYEGINPGTVNASAKLVIAVNISKSVWLINRQSIPVLALYLLSLGRIHQNRVCNQNAPLPGASYVLVLQGSGSQLTLPPD